MSEESAEEIDRFTDHARWLFAYHEGRAESLYTRAVALIGFVGVVLALLLGAEVPEGVDVDCEVKVLLIVAVLSLLATSACCLMTFKTRKSEIPSVDQLRGNWHDWVANDRRGSAAMDVTEMFLRARELDRDSALDWAKKTADARAQWFGLAVVFMGVSLASLILLLAAIGYQLYF